MFVSLIPGHQLEGYINAYKAYKDILWERRQQDEIPGD